MFPGRFSSVFKEATSGLAPRLPELDRGRSIAAEGDDTQSLENEDALGRNFVCFGPM